MSFTDLLKHVSYLVKSCLTWHLVLIVVKSDKTWKGWKNDMIWAEALQNNKMLMVKMKVPQDVGLSLH